MTDPTKPTTLRRAPFGRSAVHRDLLRVTGTDRKPRRWLWLGPVAAVAVVVLALVVFA